MCKNILNVNILRLKSFFSVKNPNFQPFNNVSNTNSIVNVLIFFVKFQSSSIKALILCVSQRSFSRNSLFVIENLKKNQINGLVKVL